MPGCIGIDIAKLPNVDISYDLNKGIPMPDNSVDEIYSNHFLEHINDLIFLIEEMHRVSKNNALIHIRVPYFHCFDAFADPTHKHFFTERSFDYFSDNAYFCYYSKARFKILRKELVLNPCLRYKILKAFLPQKYLKSIFDTYNEIVFELQVIK